MAQYPVSPVMLHAEQTRDSVQRNHPKHRTVLTISCHPPQSTAPVRPARHNNNHTPPRPHSHFPPPRPHPPTLTPTATSQSTAPARPTTTSLPCAVPLQLRARRAPSALAPPPPCCARARDGAPPVRCAAPPVLASAARSPEAGRVARPRLRRPPHGAASRCHGESREIWRCLDRRCFQDLGPSRRPHHHHQHTTLDDVASWRLVLDHLGGAAAPP